MSAMTTSVYLNHAGTSWPVADDVTAAVAAAMRSSPDEWPMRFQRCHAAVCQFFGVADANDLLLTPGCTSALSTAIHSVDLSPGSRVLTSRWEHHAVYGPLQQLADRGIEVDFVPPAVDSPFDLTILKNKLSRGDVGLVAFTAACNVTGDCLPVEAIIELSHRFDAQVLVDAAQVVGWVDLSLDELRADFVAFGGHKGLQGPWGIGGLYVAPTARMKCPTAVCAIADRAPSSSTQPRSAGRPGYCDVGSVDQYALAGLECSLKRLRDSDRSGELRIAQKFTERLRDTLAGRTDVTIYGSAHADARLPTIAFSVDGQTSGRIAERLGQRGLVVGSGLQCSPLSHETLQTSQSGLVRVSVGVSQSECDIDAATEILATFEY